MWQFREMDHKLGYRGPIWVIKSLTSSSKIEIQFPIRILVQILTFFQLKISPKNLDNRFDQNRAACGSPRKWTITWVIEVQFW